jgi:hypothetical protein
MSAFLFDVKSALTYGCLIPLGYLPPVEVPMRESGGDPVLDGEK